MSKAILLIDGSSVFHGAKALGKNIDYAKIRNLVSSRVGNSVEGVFYTPFDTTNVTQRGFIGWLAANGFKVVTTPVTHRRDNKIHMVSTEPALATDIYRYSSKGYDIHLISGNSAYMYPIQKVLDDNNKIEVYGFSGSMSSIIRRLVGNVTNLETLDVFFDRATGPTDVVSNTTKPTVTPSTAKSSDNWRNVEEEDVVVIN